VSANRISKFTAGGKVLWRSPAPGSDPKLASPLHGIAVRSDGAILATCEHCSEILVFDPKNGQLRSEVVPIKVDGDSSGPVTLDGKGYIYIAVYGSDSQLVFDPTGRLVGGRYHQAGMPFTSLNKQANWGDTFWPSPLFLPDGHGFTFGKDGLTELKVTLAPR
jgi:outer membrane protein assembly factor BamB